MRTTALWICALLVSALPAVAGAENVAPMPTVSPTNTPSLASLPQISVSGGALKCGSPSVSTLTATFTNTSATAQNTYSLDWITVQQGACTKWDSTKNPNGTPCPKSGFCAGYCLSYAPDVVKNFKTSLTLEKGASKVVSQSITNASYKKTEVKVTQANATLASMHAVSGSSLPCIF